MLSRTKKMAFIEVFDGEGGSFFERLKGFTEFTVRLNPKEYSRKYVDEVNERSEVVAYQPTISYKFDREAGNTAQQVFVDAADFECVGDEATVTIAVVDLTQSDGSGAEVVLRDYIIVPDSEGDDANMYSYSGTMRACGDKQHRRCTSTDNWKTLRMLS